MSSSAPSPDTVLEVFQALGPPGTPFTTPEVAEEFNCTDRTIYNKLDALVEDDVLETKKVGARGRVWWQPLQASEDGRERETNTTKDLGLPAPGARVLVADGKVDSRSPRWGFTFTERTTT
ncbi:helix-turn-helix domain-containing protein [Haladaptatus pallidirubidus]|uniref:HTH domain-containing protein n=1 Tax=Haladaptatus pallidirubidus TaxID=1008152 RepID=A0AAV3UH39_9EURY|nr:helix-turn-helix domain-containing protein [Haladaptatus pallidirubidus]